eukprot:764075-Hanusia_phi.AAC.7
MDLPLTCGGRKRGGEGVTQSQVGSWVHLCGDALEESTVPHGERSDRRGPGPAAEERSCTLMLQLRFARS